MLLDEVTYMLTYGYLELDELKEALLRRPVHQTVILTGRGCHRDLLELADTVTEMRPVKRVRRRREGATRDRLVTKSSGPERGQNED